MATSGITSIVFFFIITTTYFIIQNYIPREKVQVKNIASYIYFALVIIVEYILQYNLTLEMCGEAQSSILYTALLPWVFIFGLIKIALTLFPSWLGPFSNTFGYLVTQLMGIKDLFNNILKNPDDMTRTSDNASLIVAIQDIYTDQSLIINKITTNNFDKFWEKMTNQKFFRPTANEFKDKLEKLVYIKELVSEYLWYILTGFMVSSLSYNAVTSEGCNVSAKEMKKRHDDFEKKEQAIQEDKGEDDPKIYKSYE